MFEDSTFQFRFDDDDDSGEHLFESNQDLPDALDCSHNGQALARDSAT